jgi:hypothetical protein
VVLVPTASVMSAMAFAATVATASTVVAALLTAVVVFAVVVVFTVVVVLPHPRSFVALGLWPPRAGRPAGRGGGALS